MTTIAKAQTVTGFRGFAAMLFVLAASPVLNSQGVSFKIISLGFGVHYTILALSEIPTGLWADIFGSKKSAIIGCVFQGLSQLIFLFAGQNTEFVLIGFFLTGLGTSFISGALSSLMYRVAKSDLADSFNSSQYFSKIEKVAVASYILASLSIGFLSEAFGSGTFLFSAGTFFCAAIVVVLGFREPKKEKVNLSLRVQFTDRFKAGVSSLKKSLQLKILLPVRMLHQVESILGVLWLPWISQLGGDGRWMSVLATGSYVLRYLVNQCFSKKETPASFLPRITISLLFMALGSLICVFAENVFIALFGVWTMAGARGAFLPAVQAVQHEEFPENVRTTGLSVMNFSTGVMVAVSYFVSSAVVDQITVSTAWLISSICFTGGVVLCCAFGRKIYVGVTANNL